ncbi:restriction endonuclease, partial [bacterium]|nr:restriction endonuclease [bacterium]
MAIWLVRAGSHGEFEQKFLQENRVYVTWDSLDVNIGAMSVRDDLISAMTDRFPEAKTKTILNWVSQVWPFGQTMQQGDWVVLPSKSQPVVYIGEITGDYQFAPEGPNPYYHWRPIKWIGEEIPRSNFSQDLLYSFGAFMTICRIKRNNAEERIKAMAANDWKPESNAAVIKSKVASADSDDAADDTSETNLEELAKAQITRIIEAKFKGHELTRLVAAILRAQGYSTWQSPEGADGGADILAGSGPMGFGEQGICVEVKSGTGMV